MSATYTVKQVAEILGYSTNSIYTFLKEHRIKAVRVGKGRFRIPQSEVHRLLLITKSQTAEIPAPATIVLRAPHIPFSLSFFGRADTASADIFDWFIGTAAIIAGATMFLFNQTFGVVNVRSVAPVISAVRILLMGGGVGILLTNFVSGTHKMWHNVFRGILAAAGIILTTVLLLIRDVDAAGIYGALTIVITLTMFVRLGNIVPFALYLSLLAAIAPVVAFVAPGDSHVSAVAAALHVSPLGIGIGLTCLSLGFIILLWRGIYRNHALFWLCSYAAAFVYFALAFWFARGQFWSRAFYFMMIGLASLYLPSWEDILASRSKKVHTLAIGVFAAVMALVLVAIAVVSITQLNVISTMKRENAQKVDFARTMIERDIQSVKSTVTAASINADLLSAVQNNDIPGLTDVSRIIFDSSDSIRRIVILDRNGKGLFLYPLGTFDQTDLSFRDYFIRARDTGKVYVSDVFEALVDNAHRKVITISAPLYTSDKKFVGVLAASVNLDAISARLQKIAVVDRGEYIVVLDSQGKRIMHPQSSRIGTDTEPGDPTLLALQGKTGVAEGDTYDGIHSLIAYTPIRSIHWAIALKAPYSDIYALSGTANIVVSGLIIGCIVIAVLLFQMNCDLRYKKENGGGSP